MDVVTAATSRIFISHAGRDRAWAEWARWHLESAGYVTELDSLDWPAGTNFIQAMHQALNRRNPMLILLSGAYLDPDRFTTDEWTARLAQRRRRCHRKCGRTAFRARFRVVTVTFRLHPVIIPSHERHAETNR